MPETKPELSPIMQMAAEGVDAMIPKQQAPKPKPKRNRWKDPKYLEDVASRLAAKATPGMAGVDRDAALSGSIIPFGAVHPDYAKMVEGAHGGPVTGWDTSKLEPDEMQLLRRMQAARKRWELQQRQATGQ